MIEVDEFDLKILRAIQKDARIPQSELGEKVSLSTAAINRRLKKLKANGVIKQYTALLNQEALGFGLTIIANIEVESEKYMNWMQRAKILKTAPSFNSAIT